MERGYLPGLNSALKKEKPWYSTMSLRFKTNQIEQHEPRYLPLDFKGLMLSSLFVTR